MPTITAFKNDFEGLLGRGIAEPELQSLLGLCKAELKSMDEATGEMRIELTDTNRPDLWCIEGVARQMRAALGSGIGDYGFFGSPPGADRRIVVDPSLMGIRPFIAGFEAEGISVTSESLKGIIEVQEKLCEAYGRRRKSIAIGVYNSGKISWPVNYDAVNPEGWSFTPLGCAVPMTLREILQRHPKGVEYGGILAGLGEYPILYDAEGLTLSFPPIINSRDLGEVSVGDASLFVEATGTDQRQVIHALAIMAANMADRGGRITRCTVDYPFDTPLGRSVATPCDVAGHVDLDPALLSRSLGIEAGPEEIADALVRYGLRVERPGQALRVYPPPFRADYMHPCDAVEDFAISRGFAAFEPEMPSDFTVGGLSREADFEDAARELLAGFGFEETFSNVLTSTDALRSKMHIPPGGVVEIENAMSATFAAARDSIIPCLLDVESVSIKAAYPHRIFEVGEVCAIERKGGAVASATRVAAAALVADGRVSFSDLHSYLALLLHYLGADPVLAPCERPFLIPGRAAEILARGRKVGVMGEIHPAVLDDWGVKTPAAAFEIDLTALMAAVQSGTAAES